MEVNVIQLSDAEQEIEVKLNYDEILTDIEEAYKEERKNISIDGFRKGKAPIGIIKKLYGESIEYKASEKIATKKFWVAVNQEKLKPISTPQLVDIDFVIGSKLLFKVKYEIKPKLQLKNYKGLEIEKPIFKVKDDDVQKEIDHLMKPYLKFESVETITDHEHRITVNLQRIDAKGIAMIGHRSENMVILLNDEKVNPQIRENTIGKKINESFSFSFVDEHQHGEELHKEEFYYDAEITKIEKIVKPELNEELIQKISNNKSKTLDELHDLMYKNFTDYYTKQSEEIFVNNLLNEIVKNNDFFPPPGYVDNIHHRLIEIEKENAKRYQMKSVDEKAISDYYKPRAEWNAKWQIVLENIAEIENIKVDDSELEELAKQESEKTGISVQKLIKYYKDSNRDETLLEDKVISFLKGNNRIKEVDAEKKLKEKKGK